MASYCFRLQRYEIVVKPPNISHRNIWRFERYSISLYPKINDQLRTKQMITEKKRIYRKPSMKVYEMKQQPRILAGSGDGELNPLSPFNFGDDPLSNP